MVSFAAEDMTSGGLNEADVVIRESHFEVRSGDYGDQVTYVPKFETEDGELKGPFFFNVGNGDFWEVSADGRELVRSDGTDKGVSKQSSFGKFMASLQKAGMPAEILASGDIGALEGVRIHIVQVDLGKSEGGKDKFTFEATNVYEDSISQKALKGASKKKGKKSKKAKEPVDAGADADEDTQELATQFIVEALEELDEGETYTAEELGQLAFRSGDFKGKQKRAITALVSDPDFLAAGSDWEFDEDEQTVSAS